MRRLIGYITTAIAMLLAIGVGATPIITKLNNGREFTSTKDYREVVFNIAENTSNSDNNKRASLVADEMGARLKNYNVEDYSIKVQGEDTVTVALDMDSKNYNLAAKYLSFSGGEYALVAGETVKNDKPIFKTDEIKLTHEGDAEVPIIILPLTNDGISYVKELINELNGEGGDSTRAIKRAEEPEEGEGEEGKYIYLWANFDDTRGESIESLNGDPIVREKILMAFNADNIWYENKNYDPETTLFYMCASASAENPNELDTAGLKDQNARAHYLENMLKAKKYDFEISCPTANISKDSMSVDYFTNAKVLKASAEPLISLGNNINIAFSKTFIASIVAIVIVSLILIVYYRLSALAIIATTLSTLFITLISFTGMHVLFNIPAVIGFIALTSGIMFGEIFHVNRFREEVYKGRSVKKANQEASKKANLPIIDATIVLAFTGLMMYAIGGTSLKPLGVVLFFGAIFEILMNLLVFKLLMYLLTNSTNLQSKYRVFNINGNKVPSLLDTVEKPAYETPYEKVDFTKKKSLASIIFGALSVAAITCIIVFGAISKNNSPLNVEKAVGDTTQIYANIQVEGDNMIISDSEAFVTYVLKDTKYAEVKDIDKDVELKKVSKYVYDAEESKEEQYYFFALSINEKLSDSDLINLEDSLNNNLVDILGSSLPENTYAIARNSHETTYAPSQGFVALATGISIIGVSIYAAFRFRPSRGVALFAITTGATAIAYGTIVGIHAIGTTAITSVAMPLVAVTTMIASLFYFLVEKSALKESSQELTPELRNQIMIKSLGKCAAPLFVFSIVGLYIIINFFGFGVPDTCILFASAFLGELVGVAALLCVCGPLACETAKLLGKIHLPKIKLFKKTEKAKVNVTRNSSEPEETIFIGIND